MFTSLELAQRIEAADVGFLHACVEAARRADPGSRAIAVRIGGGVATWTSPHSPMNKVVGLGSLGPVDDGELDEVERAFFERDSPVQVELATTADPAVGARLTERGYVLRGFENVSGRALEPGPAPAPPDGVTISHCDDDEDLDAWIDASATGFLAPDTEGVASHESFPRDVLEKAMREMLTCDGIHRFFAHRGGEVAGTATMRVAEGIAQLCGASTLPAHRRRGIQSAVLAHRLAFAADAGCDLSTVTTLPGSKSQQNVQRQGYDLLFSRAILVREPS